MNERDPLQCTFEDARRNQLRDGIALSTAAKVAYFEEMVEFAVYFGARDRLAHRRGGGQPKSDRLLAAFGAQASSSRLSPR